jgi:hypothetical protein
MPSLASLGDRRNLPSNSWINETKGLVALIGDEQQPVRSR